MDNEARGSQRGEFFRAHLLFDASNTTGTADRQAATRRTDARARAPTYYSTRREEKKNVNIKCFLCVCVCARNQNKKAAGFASVATRLEAFRHTQGTFKNKEGNDQRSWWN